ncbi:hypothetical protein ACFPM0_16020 [Pseudonocardia sulfidoxydans]|uniref:hypothetical protein n=1 Tax=Pseudonocardia sulfidoxydans TaxID=54011 RepID=UPI003612A4F0
MSRPARTGRPPTSQRSRARRERVPRGGGSRPRDPNGRTRRRSPLRALTSGPATRGADRAGDRPGPSRALPGPAPERDLAPVARRTDEHNGAPAVPHERGRAPRPWNGEARPGQPAVCACHPPARRV